MSSARDILAFILVLGTILRPFLCMPSIFNLVEQDSSAVGWHFIPGATLISFARQLS